MTFRFNEEDVMSRYTEIQNQYEDFVAAKEAADAIKPGTVEVVYKKGEGDFDRFDGLFIYDPEKNNVLITPERGLYIGGRCACINAKDIPALIKALRDFFEEEELK
jgi:hypothetical protein